MNLDQPCLSLFDQNLGPEFRDPSASEFWPRSGPNSYMLGQSRAQGRVWIQSQMDWSSMYELRSKAACKASPLVLSMVLNKISRGKASRDQNFRGKAGPLRSRGQPCLGSFGPDWPCLSSFKLNSARPKLNKLLLNILLSTFSAQKYSDPRRKMVNAKFQQAKLTKKQCFKSALKGSKQGICFSI